MCCFGSLFTIVCLSSMYALSLSGLDIFLVRFKIIVFFFVVALYVMHCNEYTVIFLPIIPTDCLSPLVWGKE